MLCKEVRSAARRRVIYEIHEGQSMVFIREEYSDLLDFISSLCLHTIEFGKLRTKLKDPASFDILKDTQNMKAAGYTQQQINEELKKLPLSPAELEGIIRIWPMNTEQRIIDAVLHVRAFLFFFLSLSFFLCVLFLNPGKKIYTTKARKLHAQA